MTYRIYGTRRSKLKVCIHHPKETDVLSTTTVVVDVPDSEMGCDRVSDNPQKTEISFPAAAEFDTPKAKTAGPLDKGRRQPQASSLPTMEASKIETSSCNEDILFM